MNRHDDPDERTNAAEPDLNEGFQAVMDSIERLTPHDVAELTLQADAAELGHDAYALGLAFAERGEFDRARYWLHAANRYHVADARRALGEIEIGIDTHKDAQTADAESGTTIGGVVLPASHESLVHGVSTSVPCSIFALAENGGVSIGPGEGRQIIFGRDRTAVHVVLGEADRHVSRRHGTLTYRDGHWRVRNTGRCPIRIAHYELFPGEESMPLPTGFTPIRVPTPEHEHQMEILIAGSNTEHPLTHEGVTVESKTWELTHDERLTLVVLARRYLEQHPDPQPLSLQEAALTLGELQPDVSWTRKRVARLVRGVVYRLSQDGVYGLTHEDLGDGATRTQLDNNLIEELLRSSTITLRDLALIDAA